MQKQVKTLVECSMMIALATVLSVVKLVEMPYGGSITIASMLPIVLISYRHGVKYGVASGLVYGVIQQLLGLSNLSYMTTWYSVVAVILLDYLLAFAVIGLAGVFRSRVKGQSLALFSGVILTTVLRYVLHTIAGATVWAGVSIPTAAVLVYSIGYNATYMLPELIILAVVTCYVGEMIDFEKEIPTRIRKKHEGTRYAYLFSALAGLFLVVGLIVDVCLIFPKIQMPDGSFSLVGLGSVNWIVVGIVSLISFAISALFFFLSHGKTAEK